MSRLGPPEWPTIRRWERRVLCGESNAIFTTHDWACFIAPIYDDLRDVFFYFFAHIAVYCNPITGYSDLDIICIHEYLYSKFF